MAKEEENMMVKPAMVRVGVISPVTEPEAWPVLLTYLLFRPVLLDRYSGPITA